MKILIVQDQLRSGGTERQSILLANAFAAAGHAATLLTFRPGGALAGTVAPAVRRMALQAFDLRLDWFAPRLLATVRAAQPDVVLCMGRMANCHGWRLAPLAPTIATMRTGKPLPALFRRTLRAAAHVIANSADARATVLSQAALAPDQVTVIHNSLVFPPLSALERNTALSAELGARDTTTVLLSVAMFRREKNQRELIEVASSLPVSHDWQLWLAGDGPQRRHCERLAMQRGLLGGRVKFIGFHADPTPLYAAADLAVHASWSEALSNFLIEAQAHGLLAVAYAAQGIRECFIPDRTGWVIPPGDREAFRSALISRISEPAPARGERAAEARCHARQTFDPERQVCAHLDLFRRLANPSPP